LVLGYNQGVWQTELKYTVDLEDYVAFSVNTPVNQLTIRKAILRLQKFGFTGVGLLLLLGAFGAKSPFGVIACSVAALVLLLHTTFRIKPKILKSVVKQTKARIQNSEVRLPWHVTLTFRPDAIISESERGKNEYKYSSLTSIDYNFEMVSFMLDGSMGMFLNKTKITSGDLEVCVNKILEKRPDLVPSAITPLYSPKRR